MAVENPNEELVRQIERLLRIARETGKDVRAKIVVVDDGTVVGESKLIEKKVNNDPKS